MTEDNALLYPLAGLFSIVLSVPVLIFWKGTGWARTLVIFALLGSIVACWWFFDLSKPGADMLRTMFAMTLIPPVVAAMVAGLVELKFRADEKRHHRRLRRRRRVSSG